MRFITLARACLASLIANTLLLAAILPASAQHYGPHDLGTLGGVTSQTVAMNDGGQVAGSSTVSGDQFTHAFLWTPTTPNGTSGTMTDLGTLGGNNSYAVAMNKSGQVVGVADTGSGYDRHAFLWTRGGTDGPPGNPQMKDLDTVNSPYSQSNGINNSGQVTGWVQGMGPFLYDSNGTHYLQAGDSFFPANPLVGDVRQINDAGEAIADTAGGAAIYDSISNFLRILIAPPSWNGNISATAINSSGAVIGGFLPTWHNSHAFVSDGTNFTDLGTLGSTYFYAGAGANGMNDSGQVVGYSEFSSYLWHAFLWTPGGTDGIASNPQMKDLGALGGIFSTASAINNSGVVVGVAETYDDVNGSRLFFGGSAFAYDSAGMHNLGTLGGHFSTPVAINSIGMVAGYSTTIGYSNSHACIWSADYPPLDKTPPITTVSLSGTLGSEGWYVSGVTITLNATDPDSGSPAAAIYFSLDGGVNYQRYAGPILLTGDGIHSLIVSSVDSAGNGEQPSGPTTIKIDTTPPWITSAGGAYLLNQLAAASYNVTDATSGIANSSATPIDTSTVGVKSFIVTATDHAGNTLSQPFSYMVAYGVDPLYDQTKAVKSGGVIPIKLYLADFGGADVSASAINLHATGVVQLSTNSSGMLESPGNSSPDNNFHFDATLGPNGGYVYNLSTAGFVTGTYALSFTAGTDPTVHTVQFQVK